MYYAFILIGAIDAGEIVESFKKMGVHMEKSEAQMLLNRYA